MIKGLGQSATPNILQNLPADIRQSLLNAAAKTDNAAPMNLPSSATLAGLIDLETPGLMTSSEQAAFNSALARISTGSGEGAEGATTATGNSMGDLSGAIPDPDLAGDAKAMPDQGAEQGAAPQAEPTTPSKTPSEIIAQVTTGPKLIGDEEAASQSAAFTVADSDLAINEQALRDLATQNGTEALDANAVSGSIDGAELLAANRNQSANPISELQAEPQIDQATANTIAEALDSSAAKNPAALSQNLMASTAPTAIAQSLQTQITPTDDLQLNGSNRRAGPGLFSRIEGAATLQANGTASTSANSMTGASASGATPDAFSPKTTGAHDAADFAATLKQAAEQPLGQNANQNTNQNTSQTASQTGVAPGSGPLNPLSSLEALAGQLSGQISVQGSGPVDPSGQIQTLSQDADKGSLLARAQSQSPANQVGIGIARAAMDGQSRFTIRMDPPELGRIEVKLAMQKDGSVQAMISADNRDAFDMLQRDARSLERLLQDAGLKTDSNSLNFSLNQQGGRDPGSAFAHLAQDSDQHASPDQASDQGADQSENPADDLSMTMKRLDLTLSDGLNIVV
ncbi:hypothetical protein JCM17846_10990 [Iodidimonas nitroreducens]|uniref:Flagellar hook-length control protein-like C-terminal domain-containing protein n=1 Tax=Iodidimonas nitroreducens TaxID=1236968 RepID=A0A5A7N5Y5_9PROT|nr:hypothetical protein JCM17846_10990 [Iodidimonas nitroreducens]